MVKFDKLGKSDINKVVKKEKKVEKKKNVHMILLRTLEVLVGVAYAVILFFGKYFFAEDSSFYKSFNVFSASNPEPMARLLSYALLVIVVGTLLRIFIKALSKNKTITKKTSVAVLQLFGNLVKYVMAIFLICLGLSALGVDTAAILGSLGIIALIIGLGVTSLIEDIVAGIFIIAERTFDVGDIIVVDGFRGTVVSIGIRSTKIADVGDDVLTLRNSSIGSVINLTDRESCAALYIPIAPEESLEKVEKIIEAGHIEKIKDTCDKIIGDPMYLGLCEITPKGVQMLLFIAGCKEDDRYDVERALYHGIKLILENNGVKLGHPGIVEEED